MSKWINVSEINNTLGKAIEACKDELTPAFYSGAKCVLDKINEMAEQTEPQTEETEMERLERIDNELEDAWARIRELTTADTPQADCDRYVIVNDEGERAYNCIGCQTDCPWK